MGAESRAITGTAEPETPARPEPEDAPGAVALSGRRPALDADAARRWLPPILAALAGVVFGWKTLATAPEAGIDPSWIAALHLAAERGLDFGRDVVYTYGPLGFLKHPAWWGGETTLLGILYDCVTRFALFFVVFVAGRRSFGWPAAVLLVLLVAALVEDPAVPLAFAGALWLLGNRERSGKAPYAMAAALGVLAGVEALAKINTGATVLVLVAIALAVAPGRARLRLGGVAAGAALVAGLTGWIATGQQLGALFDYALNAARIVSGYSAAMLIEDPALTWQYTAALVVFVAGGVGVWLAAAPLERLPRGAAVVLWLAVSWLSFKQGFVRHDTHAIIFFATLLAVLAVVPWPRALRGYAVAALMLPFLTLVATSNLRLDDIVAPFDRAEMAWDQVEPALSGADRDAQVEQGDRLVAAEEGLDARTLALLRGRTVHVAPTETAVIAAYDLRWRPLPVFQDYQAYTAGLDQLNADALLADDAPERILMGRNMTIDGRWPGWDPPAQARALLCRYRPLRAQGDRWLVLDRGENRCGAPRLTGSVRAAWDERVGIPRPTAPDRMTFVRVAGVQVGGLERLRGLLYKPHERRVAFDAVREHRLIAATAGAGLLLETPAYAELPGSFAFAPKPRVVQMRRLGGMPEGKKLRFDFYEVPVAR